MKKYKINVPDALLESMTSLAEIIHPEQPEIAIVILGENMEEKHLKPHAFHIIHVYFFLRVDDEYHFVKELESFSFEDFRTAQALLLSLPSMSAFDLMIYQNGIGLSSSNLLQ
ncbi:hypothetical protein [Sporosarcina sp. Te-1]|uniref:hypothetical protein n=1 Tax=Sporosarcina sp. Te-1 TaxID=2818390 RepID=UPI001A9D3A74|nr:hypothetical protein [Sporosarcina sp. Te-1]QTD40821.1 hypothetical protein J3U78_19070 [Sporosarcina sp. Te-1]